jgi:hypothetical protein
MNNGQLVIDNEKRDSEREELSIINYQLPIKKYCSACGAESEREGAKFCPVCGKLLVEDYQPLDSLRASYRLQGKFFLVENAKKEEISNLFPKNENAISETAWACVVYSFVPYLGILFVPLAFAVGFIGVAVSFQKPNLGGRKLALTSVAVSFIVLAIQVLLWWLLYIIPEVGKQI